MHFEATLEDLGYSAGLLQSAKEQGLDGCVPARVIAEHRERYVVKNDKGEYEAEVLGILRFSARTRADFPAVGDWVAINTYEEKLAIIHRIFPRKTLLERQAVGKFGEKQIIAANVDYSLIVVSSDRDFNLNRLERYLTISHSAKIVPVILLSKTDLLTRADLDHKLNIIKMRVPGIAVIPISNLSHHGFDVLKSKLEKGMTYCLLGSSGAGKSSIINNLVGQEMLKTTVLSTFSGKGKHTTSRRELFVLEEGGMIIDNPGMREVGVTENEVGVESTFDRILKFSVACRYADCSHTHESGCAVIAAVDQGKLDRALYLNYLKVEREKEYFHSTALDKRKKDREFGKVCKEVMNFKKRNKSV